MPPQMLRLRDYQQECSEAVEASHARGVRRPAIVLPTGAGKTVVFSHRALMFTQANISKRVLILAHTDELVTQAAKKIKGVAPHLQVGIVKAAKNEVNAQVVVASVQSLRSAKRREQIKRVGLIIVDECHHATASTYQMILEHYGALGPACAPCTEAAKGATCTHRGEPPADGALVEGFTATLARSDKASLAAIWQEVAFRKDIAFMIRKKYLLDVTGKRVEVPDFTTKGLKSRGGDFAADELADRLVESLAPERVAQAYAEHAADRAGLVFTPNVESAYVFAEAFNAEGITAKVVHGALPPEERRLVIKELENGDVQVLVNCMVLTEGFDSPVVSCVVVARPTKSGPLYQQMVGRALRLYSPPEHVAEDAPVWIKTPQTRALVLDVVGASRQHGLASLIDLAAREDKEELAEGQSLLEFEDYLDLATEDQGADVTGESTADEYWAGEVVVQDFDPLSRDSKRLWRTTAGGARYVPMGKTDRKTGEQGLYFVLVPSWNADAEPDAWSVFWCTQDGKDCSPRLREVGYPARPVGVTEHQDLPLSQAMVWAEQEVEELALEKGLDPSETFSKKAAPWRKREASDRMLAMARGLGVQGLPDADDPFAPRPRAGEVSDLIDNVKASQVVDHWVNFLNAQG